MLGGCPGGEGPIRGEAASTGSGWVASRSLVSVEGQGPRRPQRHLPRGICLSPQPPLQAVTSPTHASQPLQHSPHPEAALTCLCGPGLWGVHSLVPRPIRKSFKTDVSPGRGVWLCVLPGLGESILAAPPRGGMCSWQPCFGSSVLPSGPQAGPAMVPTVVPGPGGGGTGCSGPGHPALRLWASWGPDARP